jgi:hypothetical protein
LAPAFRGAGADPPCSAGLWRLVLVVRLDMAESRVVELAERLHESLGIEISRVKRKVGILRLLSSDGSLINVSQVWLVSDSYEI